jgi:Tfp pilus assembly protein FimT
MVVLFAITIPLMHNWVSNYDYRQTSRQITSMCREARNLAISKNLQHMVVFAPGNNSYSMFMGSLAYNTPSASYTQLQQLFASGTAQIRTGLAGGSTNSISVQFNPNGTAILSDPLGNANDGNVSVNDGTTQKFLISISTTGRINLQKKY